MKVARGRFAGMLGILLNYVKHNQYDAQFAALGSTFSVI